MATRVRDNDEERFARIDALMEAYRIKHDDLKDFVEAARIRAATTRAHIRLAASHARHRVKTRKR